MIDESNLDTEEDLVTPTIEQLSILDEKVLIQDNSRLSMINP